MKVLQTIPILRIFDHEKAMDFYINWLGFKVDWEHRFDKNAPLYMQISREGILLHLSEHHGDGSPGANVFLECTGLKEFHQELTDKKYKYNRPDLERTFYDAWCVNVIDPAGNRLSFNERD